MRPDRIAIDLSRWQGASPEEIRGQIASFPIEAGNLPFEKRTTVVAVSLDSFFNLLKPESDYSDDLATAEIYNWASLNPASVEIWTKDASQEEILRAMKELRHISPGKMLVWISPKEKGVYEETRIGIYQIIKVNGEKYLFFRTLCSNHSIPECSQIARSFLKSSSDFKHQTVGFSDPQILRATPVPIDLPPNDPFDYLSSVVTMPAVFKAIKEGRDIDRNLDSLKQADQIITKQVYQEIQSAANFQQQLAIGREIERQIQERSGTLLLNGTCGILYSSLPSSPLNVIFGSSGVLTEGSGRRKHCGKCGKTGYFTEGESCPYDNSSQN